MADEHLARQFVENVGEAHHREVARDGDPAPGAPEEHTGGDRVVAAEDGIRPAASEQSGECLGAFPRRRGRRERCDEHLAGAANDLTKPY